jgi:DNA-binding transcriptional ArsR family regulator
MLTALAGGPLSVNELCGRLDLPQSTASRHLRILRDQALVVATRDAQRVLYRLKDRHLLKIIAMLDRYLEWTRAPEWGEPRPPAGWAADAPAVTREDTNEP